MPDLPAVEGITSLDDLVEYIELLASQIGAGQLALQNPMSVDCLQSAASWIRDKRSYLNSRGDDFPQAPDWKFLAEVLSAAVVYE
jgi:hypothetical protein